MVYVRRNNWPRGEPEKKSRNAKIIHLYEVKHWTQEKIGAKFGITGSRVSRILKRARERGEIT